MSNNRQSTSWDKKNLIKNFGFNTLLQFSAASTSFLTIWWITKTSSKEALGISVAIIAGSQTISLFSNWTMVFVTRMGTEEYLSTKMINNTFSNRLIVLIANIFIISLTYPLWINYLISLLKLPKESGVLILVQYILISLSAHLTGSFQAIKLVRMQSILLLAEKISVFLILFLLPFFILLKWNHIVITNIISSLVIVLISLKLIWPYFKLNLSFKEIKNVLAFSAPLLPYSVTTFFSTNYLDAYFISNYLSKEDLGTYSILYQLYGIWMQLPTILGALLLPMFITYIFNDGEKIIKKYIEQFLPIIIILWSVVSCFTSIILAAVVSFLFNIEYNYLASLLLAFMLGSAFAVPNLIGYSPYIIARKIIFFSFPLAFLVSTANVFGNTYLIPKFGLIGATYATIFSTILSFLTCYLFFLFFFKIVSNKTILSILPSLLGIITSFYFNIFVACLITFITSIIFLWINKHTVIDFYNLAKIQIQIAYNKT